MSYHITNMYVYGDEDFELFHISELESRLIWDEWYDIAGIEDWNLIFVEEWFDSDSENYFMEYFDLEL